MGRTFTVNYGGPGVKLSSLPSQYEKILQGCVDFYSGGKSATKFTVNDLDVTVFGTGIHPGIKVELPDSVEEALKNGDNFEKRHAQATLKLFVRAKARAGDFNTTDYKLWSNNCVSAVSNVLSTLDPSFTKKHTKPWSLDSEVEHATKLQRRALEIFNTTSKIEDSAVETLDLSSTPAPLGAWDAMTDVSKQNPASETTQKFQTMKSALQDAKDDAEPQQTASNRIHQICSLYARC